MFKLKFILPMFAFVLAIGMSFAFTSEDAKEKTYATKYILVESPDGWAEINVECDPGLFDCVVEYSQDPLNREFTVYNSTNTSDKATSSGELIIIEGAVPTLE